MPAKAMVRRTGHTPGQLRELARKHRFRDCRRRMRAIALAMEDGLSRAEVASGAGVGARTLRDWIVRYSADGRAVADVRKRTADSFGVGCALEGARQLVRRLGFRHMSPRPVHPRADPAARGGNPTKVSNPP